MEQTHQIICCMINHHAQDSKPPHLIQEPDSLYCFPPTFRHLIKAPPAFVVPIDISPLKWQPVSWHP